MKIGAIYPQIELRGDPDAVRQIGDSLESMGYDHLLAYDHVLGAVHADREPALMGPYTENDPFHEPFMLFSYLAGRTTTLEFVTGIIILPQRQTSLVAKQVADLAVLSGNRIRLGIGTGWNYVEYESLGVPFGKRGKRMDEQVDVLRALWTEHVVDLAGDFHRIDRAGILPRPTEVPEIWCGGFSTPAFERAARTADGFIFGGSQEVVAPQWGEVTRLLEEHDRPVDGFGAEYPVYTRKGPKDAAAKVDWWRNLGGTHVCINTMNLGLDSADAHLDYLGQVQDALA